MSEEVKVSNPEDSTLIGGFTSWAGYDGNKPSFKALCWDYSFLYGICRITKNWAFRINVPGNHFSFHINTYGKWKKCQFATHCHWAFIKKFPYVLLGFKSIQKYIVNE